MKTIPVQVVVVKLENGQRGVFFGTPLISDDGETEHQIESVWFSGINQLPNSANLEQIAHLVEYFEDDAATIH